MNDSGFLDLGSINSKFDKWVIISYLSACFETECYHKEFLNTYDIIFVDGKESFLINDLSFTIVRNSLYQKFKMKKVPFFKAKVSDSN